MGQQQDANQVGPAIPVGPDHVAIADQPAQDQGQPAHGRRYHRPNRVPDQTPQPSGHANTWRGHRADRQRSGADIGLREQRLTLEIGYFRHVHVHFRDKVRAGLHQHVAPLTMVRVALQRNLIVRGGRPVLFKAVVGRRDQGVQPAVGIFRQLGAERGYGLPEPALFDQPLHFRMSAACW